MKKKRLLMLIGSVCLILVLAALLLPACAKEAPPEGAEAELEAKLAAEKAKTAELEDEITDLEAEIAELRAPAPAEEVLEWRLQTLYSEGIMWRIEHFADAVEEMSDGRLILNTFSSGVLVPPEEEHHAVQGGTLEMSYDCGAYCADVIDIGNIEFGLPLAWDGASALWTIFIEMGMFDLCQEAYAENGIYYLATSAEPPYAMIGAKPIGSLKDIEGMKIRAYGLTAKWLDSLGAKTTYLPCEEIYLGLMTGTIDAAVYGGATDYLGMGLGEPCKYYLVDPYLVNPNTDSLLINMDAWESLSDNLKGILQIAGWEGMLWQHTRMHYEEMTGIEGMGLEAVHWPAEDIATAREAAMIFWDEEAAKSARCAEAIQIMKDWAAISGG